MEKDPNDPLDREIDFSNAKRGPVISQEGKTPITIYLDNAILEKFRVMAHKEGKAYQTLIHEALRRQVGPVAQTLTAESVRRIFREELKSISRAGRVEE